MQNKQTHRYENSYHRGEVKGGGANCGYGIKKYKLLCIK